MRLAARCCRIEGKCHPQEWLKFYLSFTEYQWALLVTLDRVDPWGERRDDERSSFHFANLLAVLSGDENAEVADIAEILNKFTAVHLSDDEDDE